MIRLCVASQTPPTLRLPSASPPAGQPWRLGIDYVPQMGGVIPMMRALLHSSLGRWVAPRPLWVALGDSSLPRRFATDGGYTVETIDLDARSRADYVEFKEAVWRSFHGPWGMGPFPSGAYRGYVNFNHRMAQRLLDHVTEYDLAFVNDFQLLLVGGLVGSAAPVILRWHIPLELRGYPEQVRRFFLRAMEGSDAIVVSTRFALEELIRRGFHGRAFQVYPYLDPRDQAPVPDSEVRKFRDRFGLGDHPYIISVGRMDPVKRQDLLLAAFGRIRRRFPDHRLVLVGGGSFSTRLARAAGEPTKDSAWMRRLAEVSRSSHLEGSAVFAGRLEHLELRAAYQGASLFVHPAPWEGFGLVAIEAWMHGLPVIVSRGAGVSELVTDGVNGFTVPPGSVNSLSQRMARMLTSPSKAERMGESGRLGARRCHVRFAAPRLREIFNHVIRTYRGRGRAPPEILNGP
ncbi:MAG TPA: glycosyltransferase family 4 protein [Thermoplasmata archaeon]|nr:glycosyltransferase family 4 protein [Thermoplasmata archaeon]